MKIAEEILSTVMNGPWRSKRFRVRQLFYFGWPLVVPLWMVTWIVMFSVALVAVMVQEFFRLIRDMYEHWLR